MILVNVNRGAAQPQAEEWPESPGTAAPGDWQFKIVRGRFGSRIAIQALQEEQAEFGWRLVEVLDDDRIRFGRPTAVAAKDVAHAGNPFSTRSRVGSRAASLPLIVLGGMAALLAFWLLIVSIRGVEERSGPAVATPVPTVTTVTTVPTQPAIPPPPTPVEVPPSR
jgi:hypothetical protein